MQFSSPIYRLRRRARLLSREQDIPLHKALDQIARDEGFRAWSLLAASASQQTPTTELLTQLQSGDLLLLGARRGHGKTLLALELALQSVDAHGQAAFFSFEYNEDDVLDTLAALGKPKVIPAGLTFDNSPDICADYLIEHTASLPRRSVVVVDYLQLLDQRRANAPLAQQVRRLKSHAAATGLILVFVSQIDAAYDAKAKLFPGLTDVRMPNPLSLSLFSKACFLSDGEIRLSPVGSMA